MTNKRLFLAQKRGFCGGVCRAIALVEEALKQSTEPLYLLHALVHNRTVIAELEQLGELIVVETLNEVPDGARVVFSAHGVAQEVWDEAVKRQLKIIDATCLLVKRIHKEIAQAAADEKQLVIFIGHRKHPETIGTLGQAPGKIWALEDIAGIADLPEALGRRVAVWSQTTLSVNELNSLLVKLKTRYPGLSGGQTLCYATTERQEAVRLLASQVELLIVLGSPESSNANQLATVAHSEDCQAILAENINEIPDYLLEQYHNIGLTAGASTPEHLITEAVEKLHHCGFVDDTKNLETV